MKSEALHRTGHAARSWLQLGVVLGLGFLGASIAQAGPTAPPTVRPRPRLFEDHAEPGKRTLFCGTCGRAVATVALPPPPVTDGPLGEAAVDSRTSGTAPILGAAPTAPTIAPVVSEAVVTFPPVDAACLALASQIVVAGGTADATDADIVAHKLAGLPLYVLEYVHQQGLTVVACRNSIVDFDPTLKGVTPRGWPADVTWDDVPGIDLMQKVVVAVIGHGTPAGPHVPSSGEGEGSFNLVLHELGHGIDYNNGCLDSFSQRPDWLEARSQDIASLTTYEGQAGIAGPEETWAETFASYYGGNPALAKTSPELNNLMANYDQFMAHYEAGVKNALTTTHHPPLPPPVVVPPPSVPVVPPLVTSTAGAIVGGVSSPPPTTIPSPGGGPHEAPLVGTNHPQPPETGIAQIVSTTTGSP